MKRASTRFLRDFEVLKLRRVAPGYYLSRCYPGVSITRTIDPSDGSTHWYYQTLVGGDVHDWYDTKRDAVAACVDCLRFGA